MAAPKQPQDHKISAAEAEALKTPFVFTGADAESYELPTFSITDAGLTAGFVRKNRKNDAELLYTIVEALAPADALDALDELSPDRFGEVMKEWQEHSGAELPKS